LFGGSGSLLRGGREGRERRYWGRRRDWEGQGCCLGRCSWFGNEIAEIKPINLIK